MGSGLQVYYCIAFPRAAYTGCWKKDGEVGGCAGHVPHCTNRSSFPFHTTLDLGRYQCHRMEKATRSLAGCAIGFGGVLIACCRAGLVRMGDGPDVEAVSSSASAVRRKDMNLICRKNKRDLIQVRNAFMRRKQVHRSPKRGS